MHGMPCLFFGLISGSHDSNFSSWTFNASINADVGTFGYERTTVRLPFCWTITLMTQSHRITFFMSPIVLRFWGLLALLRRREKPYDFCAYPLQSEIWDTFCLRTAFLMIRWYWSGHSKYFWPQLHFRQLRMMAGTKDRQTLWEIFQGNV